MLKILLAYAVVLVAVSTDDALAPWALNHDPTDVAKQHVREITDGRALYVVVQGGTMDGRNCRSPQGVWQPFEQTWESNLSVRMENIGTTDVINPWLSNGQNDFRSLDKIVARVIEPNMTDGEKARALWWQEVQERFHLEGDNGELLDPVKVFNVYGYNTCGNDSICLAGLWRKAGLKVAPARLVGHCVTQVFYDGAWHLIADYHFELSGRADMKWPLSMSFAKLVSRTADAGKPRYTLPGPGLLNPGTNYFWHVRRAMTRGSGDRGVQLGTSRREDLRPLKMSASNSTASTTGASFTGHLTR